MSGAELTAAPPAGWHRGDWMLTFTGHQFYPMAPRPEDVDLLDIAHSLSMQCRYNGHVDRFYSVAEHCCLMADYFINLGSDHLALWALLHDATEAYVGDMVRPLKLNMPEYVAVEDRVMLAVGLRFGLAQPIEGDFQYRIGLGMPDAVKEIDTRILLTEREALLSNYRRSPRWAQEGMEPIACTIFGWSPEEAQAQYLRRAEVLGIS